METAKLLIELGLLTLALATLGRFAGRFGFSPIPLYLLGGLVFGAGGLYHLNTSEGFLETGAEIGVILLLLLMGLEYSARELVTSLRQQAPAGLVDFVLNAVPGFAAGLILGWPIVACVALAGVTWVSSSGVIVALLSDLGRLGNRETPAILAVLVLEDLAMAIYLPILTALLAGATFLAGGLSLMIGVLALTTVLFVAVRYSDVISRLVSSDQPQLLLLSVLGVTLLVAGIAQELQVSAAVGAFLVGIAISGDVAEKAHVILSPLRDLFAALFFVMFGLATDPRDLVPVLLPAAILAIVTAVTKIATGYWAARRAGVATLGRWRAGAALVARGEFAIVIAGLAAAAGVAADLRPLTTAYVLMLVVAAPVLARLVEPAGRWWVNRRRAGAPAPPSSLPSHTLPPGGAVSPYEDRGQSRRWRLPRQTVQCRGQMRPALSP